MLSKSNDYVSISLSENVLKVAHIKGAGPSPKLVQIITKDLSGSPDTAVPAEIQAALKGLKLKSANLVAVIPPGMTTTKNIEIPSTNPSEIESIVDLQAGRHTPFSREEIQIGYINIGVYKSNYSKVLLVIANKNVLKGQLGMFEHAGMKVKKVVFAPEAIARFYAHGLNLANEAAPVGIIDIDKYSTEFIITLKGAAITSRNIPIGKSHMAAEGEAAQNKLIAELGKSIESYQSEDIDQAPSQYILTSDDALTLGVQAKLKEKLSWESKIVSYVDFTKAGKGVLESIARDVDEGSLLDIIASTAMADENFINLLPAEEQLQKSIEVQGKEVFKAAIFGFILLILVACIFGLRIYFHNTYLNNLKENYSQNRQDVIQLKETEKRTTTVRTYVESRMVSLDVINELYRKIPKEVYLTNLFMDKEGAVNIQGVSEIASTVYNLGTTLTNSDLFKEVEIKSTTAKKDRGKDVSAFEISLKLKSAKNKEMMDEQIKE